MAEVLEYAKEQGIDLGGVIFDKTAAELYEDEEDKTTDSTGESTGNQTGEETSGEGQSETGKTNDTGTGNQ